LARPELARLFDLAISSADAGLRKPDAEIYRHAEARLGASRAELVFVDDVEANVEAAKALGWRGVWFRSTERAIAEIERRSANLATKDTKNAKAPWRAVRSATRERNHLRASCVVDLQLLQATPVGQIQRRTRRAKAS
jgi:FMN phosphatase YigB (HAD superfamily)